MDRNLYCMLKNGELIPKAKVNAILDMLIKLSEGFSIVQLTDEELFTKGDKFDAIKRFREKYDTGLMEAKCAIEFLRGEEIY